MMSYQELQDEVRKLEGQPIKEGSEEVWNRNYNSIGYISNEDVIKALLPDLFKNFDKVRKSGQKWHSFVREIFYSPDKLNFLKDDLLRLVHDYTKSHHHEFTEIEKGKLVMPERMLDINRLRISFTKFLPIYRNILQNIHFENPIQKNYGKNINGKINWARTIQLSKTEFPTLFFTQTWQKQFEHPGNILLILCLRWQHDLANKILHFGFNEELTNIEIRDLLDITRQTKNCLTTFPFSHVVSQANQYFHRNKNHKSIIRLNKHLQIELKHKIIRNPEYQKLLEWINEFDDIYFAGMSENDSNSSLDTIKNVDLAYESWVFWNLVEVFDDWFGIKNLKINAKEEYAEFTFEGRSIFIAHEKQMAGYVTERQKPDFSLFRDRIETENLFCVFDAKNTPKIKLQSQKDIMTYQQNYQCKFGGLISEDRQKQHAVKEQQTWYISLRYDKESKKSNMENLEQLVAYIINEFYDESKSSE